MNTDDKHSVISHYLGKFRAWSYAELSARIAGGDVDETLETAYGFYRDGAEYIIHVVACWDDKPQGNIRVSCDLSVEPQISIPNGCFMPDVIDAFIMKPDGWFVVD